MLIVLVSGWGKEKDMSQIHESSLTVCTFTVGNSYRDCVCNELQTW